MNEKRTSSIALFRSLPPLFKASWLLLLAGGLGIAAGYLLRIPGPGWAGVALFLAGYTAGLWPLLRTRPAGEHGGLFVAGLVMSTVTAAFLLAIQLAAAAILGGVILILGQFNADGALRILHVIGMMTAAAVLLTLPRAVRMAAAKPR